MTIKKKDLNEFITCNDRGGGRKKERMRNADFFFFFLFGLFIRICVCLDIMYAFQTLYAAYAKGIRSIWYLPWLASHFTLK